MIGGETVRERPDVARLLSALVDHVQVSRCVEHRGVFVKSRLAGMGPVVAAGNVYMRCSNARIEMFSAVDAWRAHELACFRLVHPGVRATYEGARAIALGRLEGTALRTLLAREALELRALVAAGAELRRCHALDGQRFAHGDPHLGNVLFDGARARLIDFETRYLPWISHDERRANDLLVLALDLLGSLADARWPAGPLALADGYGLFDAASAGTRAQLARWLARPPDRGLAQVLWRSRTRRAPWSRVCARAERLACALETAR